MKVPQDRVSGKSRSPVLAPQHVLQAVDRLHNAAVWWQRWSAVLNPVAALYQAVQAGKLRYYIRIRVGHLANRWPI